MHFGNTNRNQAPKCIRNTSPTPAGHELINTVVQVGAQGENKLNKLSRISCFTVLAASAHVLPFFFFCRSLMSAVGREKSTRVL